MIRDLAKETMQAVFGDSEDFLSLVSDKPKMTREEREVEREKDRARQEDFKNFATDFDEDLGDIVGDLQNLANYLEDLSVKMEDNAHNFIESFWVGIEDLFVDGELPRKGDHIYVSRIGCTHHGIYIGGGKVIHYLEDSIREDSVDTFAENKKIRIRSEEYSPSRYSPDEIVSRAYSRLNENDYNLFDNNCEHFARWCRCNAFEKTL